VASHELGATQAVQLLEAARSAFVLALQSVGAISVVIVIVASALAALAWRRAALR
jgi:hypothetical protein